MRWTCALVLVAASLLHGAARADGDERVLPAALEGDPALVARVAEELTRRGVSVGSGDQVVLASLAQEGDDIRVALRDPQGRTTDRRVSSVETAAALVESWARRDISDPLLEPRPTLPPPPPPSPPPLAAPAVIVAEPAPPPPSRWMPVLRLAGESASHSLWLAASAGACLHVGSVCLGGSARLAHQLEEDTAPPYDGPFTAPPTWPPRRQSDLEGLFQAELPIALGRPVLLLGLGAGLGWRFDGHNAQAGLRGEARLEVAVPIWSRLALDAGLTAAVAPSLGEHDAVFPQGEPDAPELRLGLGLRWGVP